MLQSCPSLASNFLLPEDSVAAACTWVALEQVRGHTVEESELQQQEIVLALLQLVVLFEGAVADDS